MHGDNLNADFSQFPTEYLAESFHEASPIPDTCPRSAHSFRGPVRGSGAARLHAQSGKLFPYFMLRLKKTQIEEFYDAGYVVLPGVFRDAEIREIGKAFDRLRDTAIKLTRPRMIKGSYFVVEDHRINRIVWCGAAEPVLLKYGEDARLTFPSSQLLGSNEMEQLICQAHFKLPADGVGFGWHQDSDHRRYGTDLWTDVNGRGSFVQTLMAVDVMNEENGPLMVVPGSGREGHQYLKENPSPLDALFDGRAQPVLMDQGSVLLLGPYTVHGSKPNRSKHARRVFINGYAYPGANRRIYPGKGAGRKVVARP